jgi:hypothetical protein
MPIRGRALGSVRGEEKRCFIGERREGVFKNKIRMGGMEGVADVEKGDKRENGGRKICYRQEVHGNAQQNGYTDSPPKL